MAKLENRKMFANFPGFDKIVSDVRDLYSGIGTLPQRSTLDIAGQFIAQNPEAFSGVAPKGTKLPSGAAILAQDVKNLFGGISAGRQTDELLQSQMADEKQAKILDTSLDIYKKSLDQTDENKTELQGFIDDIANYNKRIQAGEELESWEMDDKSMKESVVLNKSTDKYEVQDFIELRKEKRDVMGKAKDTMVLLDEAMTTLSDPEMTTNPVVASLTGLVKVGDAFGFDVDGTLKDLGFTRLSAPAASTDTLDIINRRLALDLAEALTGNKSNFELEQLLASTPNLAADPVANQKIINILKFYADRAIAYGEIANQASNSSEYYKLVAEWDKENSGPFSATSEYQQFKSGEGAFTGMNLDADEGSYVIEGQSN